jgi:uncharacterized membrane protein YedE/YeeE
VRKPRIALTVSHSSKLIFPPPRYAGYNRGMVIFIGTLSVAFAAACIWLTVRIVNRRERWAKCALAGTIIGVPVLYVLSFGPACWWWSRTVVNLSSREVHVPSTLYAPMGWMMLHGPEPISRPIIWYATLHVDRVVVPYTWDGECGMSAQKF